MREPLAIDLFCGLGGWTAGLLAEGYFTVGFDIEAHAYDGERYPGHLVIQDVLTIHGSQFKDAALIVASPPCQEYSYMAMPWSRAKAKAAAIRADETGAELERLNRLFNACFRIQREACEAAGRHIPMVVENVRGAQPWVGRARWNFGSYYLWGDVPLFIPEPKRRAVKRPGMNWSGSDKPVYVTIAFNDTRAVHPDDGSKIPGFRFDGSGRSFQSAAVAEAAAARAAVDIGEEYSPGARYLSMVAERSERHQAEGIKQGGTRFHDATSASRTSSSKSPARKAASARIAKIPEVLSHYVAAYYHPEQERRMQVRGGA